MSGVPPEYDQQPSTGERLNGIVILLVVLVVGAVVTGLGVLIMGGFFSNLPSTSNLPLSAQNVITSTIGAVWIAFGVFVAGLVIVATYGLVRFVFGVRFD